VSAKVVNLSRARKTRAQNERKRRADANAAKFGRTKAERDAEAARQEAERKRLEGHRRDDE
jgi:hypothetical protein